MVRSLGAVIFLMGLFTLGCISAREQAPPVPVPDTPGRYVLVSPDSLVVPDSLAGVLHVCPPPVDQEIVITPDTSIDAKIRQFTLTHPVDPGIFLGSCPFSQLRLGELWPVPVRPKPDGGERSRQRP